MTTVLNIIAIVCFLIGIWFCTGTLTSGSIGTALFCWTITLIVIDTLGIAWNIYMMVN